jgi:hypothetical protein
MMTSLMAVALLLAQDAPVDDKAADQAIETFKTAYKAQAEADRADAVSKLAEAVHAKTLSKLSLILTSSDGPRVRLAAAKGMGQATAIKKQAVAALSSAFTVCAKEPAIQAGILQALGALDDPSSLALIHRSFEDKEPAVVKAALAAAAAMKNAGSIDPLIAFLTKCEKSHKAKSGGATNVALPSGNLSVNAARPEDLLKMLQEYIEATNMSLQTVTEQNLSTSTEWLGWWAKSRTTFKPKK